MLNSAVSLKHLQQQGVYPVLLNGKGTLSTKQGPPLTAKVPPMLCKKKKAKLIFTLNKDSFSSNIIGKCCPY